MDHNEMEQVLKEVRAGDIDQFGLIIDAMQKPLFVYCYHMLGHRQEAEDAVQEVFLKAFEQLDSYRHTVSFSAWMYKIAYHHCLNLLNRAKLNRVVTFLRAGIQTFSRHEGEKKIEDTEYLNNPLHVAISKLSVKERNLLILRVVEERSYDELALLFDTKPATLRKQYERALKKCKSYMLVSEGGDRHDSISATR
ncbi:MULTISPECIES: RNA polymerase sigma factor [Brevibacillus]|uniref:RNA polymerase sigma factor n=1 Tax=Brevibacillus TaxID=55080 RepID=UPI000D108B68|nr:MULTISPECIES: sigma-70 family RNA polymerase sigma factor [Brevibacillus]PSJ69892.1 RNA polymerase [Brevibacillus brevis]RED21497.1 RNA polymerase sigma-70 factor (ECF subfamily) [Brevibacillus brevis]TQK54278.1 RNA polymerase sigma-70 factor (ECF subfamily) [Brevibacillus sp. AG162]VEF87369.1 Sigma-24 [Brevibacillus brevis]GEC91744.1 RNA polymerase sigma factor [Brevibacillus brevis]